MPQRRNDRVSSRLRTLVAGALSAPRHPHGARPGADAVTGKVRTRLTAWTAAAIGHGVALLILTLITFSYKLIPAEEVFTITLRRSAGPAGEGEPKTQVAPDPGPAPAADAESDAAAGTGGPKRGPIRVGAGGEFSLEDVIAGRVGVPAPSAVDVGPPRLRLCPGGWTEFVEERRRAGALPASESCLGCALTWLKRHQRPDGSWGGPHAGVDCRSPDLCLAGREGNEVGLTALSALALTGAGGAGGYDDHKDAREAALAFLRAWQGPDGCLGPKIGGYLYAHGFATLALVEGGQRAGHEDCRAAAARAVRFIESAQQDSGGFDYTERPSGRGDACIGAVLVLALRAARDAGIPVTPHRLELARGFFARLARADGTAEYDEGGPGAGTATRGSTASTWLARLCLGTPPDDPWMVRARAQVAGWRSTWADLAAPDRDPSDTLYFWFLAAQGLIHAGPEVWRLWNAHLQYELFDAQRLDGCARGSWAPPDRWISARFGPVFTTAVAALILETYNRQAVQEAYREPLRNLRERLAAGVPVETLPELLRRAAEEGDRSIVEADLPAGMPPLGVIEFCAAAKDLAGKGGGGDAAIFASPRLRAAWLAAVQDADPAVRRRAAALTGRVARMSWFTDVARFAAAERDPEARVALLAALEKSPSRNLLDPVLPALGDADPRVVRAALRLVRAQRVLARLDDCFALAEAGDAGVRREAVATLLALSVVDDGGMRARVLAWVARAAPEVKGEAEAWAREAANGPEGVREAVRRAVADPAAAAAAAGPVSGAR